MWIKKPFFFFVGEVLDLFAFLYVGVDIGDIRS